MARTKAIIKFKIIPYEPGGKTDLTGGIGKPKQDHRRSAQRNPVESEIG